MSDALPQQARPRADILIIDDDFGMRELLSLHLANAGYRVRVAEDGVEGGKMLLAGIPDLVLLDMRMPHMGGDTLLELLRADEALKHLKIIVLTSIRNDAFLMKINALGVSGLLAKPVDKDALLATVARVLAA
jgi:CheY-like chemotaxis protein